MTTPSSTAPATEPHPARKGLPPMSATPPTDAAPADDAPADVEPPTADTPEGADTPDVFAPYDPSPSLDPLVGRRFPAECDYCAAYATMRRPFPGVYWLTTIHGLGCPGLLDEEGNK